VTPVVPPKTSDGAHHRALALWSDFHGGEMVDPETLNGIQTYDWQIMEARVEEMLASTISHLHVSPSITGIDVMLVGDMNSGSNHDELAKTNQYPLAEQGVRMGYLLGQAIERLTLEGYEVQVVSVVGNHPRLVKKPAAKDTHDNMDWVSGEIAKAYLSTNDNVVSFVNGRTSVFHKIAGRTCYVWHGDGIKSTMPGVPWGGVIRRTNEIARQHQRRQIDHFILGHFHDPNVVQGGRIFMNGSLKGVDEWVQKNFGGGSPPTQLLALFDERKSRLTDVKFITPTTGLLN
jgi:hypothetical protein